VLCSRRSSQRDLTPNRPKKTAAQRFFTTDYFITTAGHSSFEPETDTRLRTIMNELPPMTPPEMVSL
jgi:hypothetical protein